MERAGKDAGQAGQPASLGALNGRAPNGESKKKLEEEVDALLEDLDDTQDLEVHQAINSLREVQRGVNKMATSVMCRMTRRFSPPNGVPAARKPPRP
jgi:hypothetical protein